MFKVENIKFNIFLENTENEMGTLAHKKAPPPLKKIAQNEWKFVQTFSKREKAFYFREFLWSYPWQKLLNQFINF